MTILENIDSLALKCAAVEGLLSDETNRELIADRIILLLDGDIESLNFLFAGVPNDFANAGERLKAEDIFKSKHDGVKEITSISFISPKVIKFSYIHTYDKYIRPGDEEARQLILDGKYCANSKYYSDSEYSEPVPYDESTESEEELRYFEKAGVKFSRI